jgi:selenocysteine lyase/cysteine desulfurase
MRRRCAEPQTTSYRFIYIRKERLRDIAPHLPDGEGEDDIASRVHTGTTNTANVMTVAAALDFHQHIGIAAKAARLRYLRDYWVSRVRVTPALFTARLTWTGWWRRWAA